MKVEKRDGSAESRVVTGMIMDKSVLAVVADRWTDLGLFGNKWTNLVGSWCVEFYKKYHKAPGKEIESIYDRWVAKTKDKATAALVERYIVGLSNSYKKQSESNTQYLLDQAEEVFNKNRIQQLISDLEGDLEHFDIKKARERVHGFSDVNVSGSTWNDPMASNEAIDSAFDAKSEPVIQYSGALGNFFNDSLERDGLIAVMAPEKRGKTWVLMEFAYKALSQGRKVAFFEVGDMSQHQIIRRLMARVAKHPLKPGEVKIPKAIRPPEDGGSSSSSAEVDMDVKDFKAGLDKAKAWKACQKKFQNEAGSKFRLSVHPNSSISVNGIRGMLRTWEKQGWVPDVVVIDYADILAPINGIMESRDQINATWKGLRALSQEMHCLVITATQTDAASYKADVLGKSNFSEDKRKLAHVTGILGLNQNTNEKKNQVYRLNWIVLREGEFSEDKCVHVAGCLAIGSPFIVSTF